MFWHFTNPNLSSKALQNEIVVLQLLLHMSMYQRIKSFPPTLWFLLNFHYVGVSDKDSIRVLRLYKV